MTHWSRQCRCSGVNIGLGQWCGLPAEQEDGLCTRCREQCVEDGKIVLTMEQARERAMLDSTLLHD